MEAIWALQRDREQRHALVDAQLKDRQSLQIEIRAARNRHAEVLRELHHDRTNYRLMMRGLEPLAKKAFSPLKRVIDAAQKVELPSKPVIELGKQQVKALSRTFETERPKRERTSPKPIPPQSENVPHKTPAKDTKTQTALGAEKTKTRTRSAKQAYADSQTNMSAERVKTAQERLEKLREEQQQKPTLQVRRAGKDAVSPKDRLQRLRDGQIRKPRGPELDR